MKRQNNCKQQGFTLLEMLVVVIIIGILASIAIPSYLTAVDKAKYVKLMNAVDALADAEEAYYLQHRKYTQDVRALDIKLNYPLGDVNTLDAAGQTTHDVVNSYHFPDGGYVDISHTDNYDWSADHPYKLERYVWATSASIGSRKRVSYFRFLNHKDKNKNPGPGTRWCVAAESNARMNRLCRSMGGVLDNTTTYSGNGNNWYRLP